MQISLIISIINLIAIVILFIIFFTKTKNENFTGAPSGYTNLLVTDLDGNLDTFSMDTLKNDIQIMINDSLGPYVTSSTVNKYFATNDDLNTTNGDVSKLRTALSGYQPVGPYVKIGDDIALQSARDTDGGTFLYADGGHDVARQACKSDPSQWPSTNCHWTVASISSLTQPS
jgi:hypothetical protein